MSVKMRLARHGRKRYAFYHIVIADSRAPRDGRYIERIGSYNPNTNPATIDLDFDSAYEWLLKGAQPTDTVRNILSYKGVLYKKHLMGGVQKGAFDEAEAERRLQAWMNEKEAKIQEKVDSLLSKEEAEAKKRLAAEAKVNEERLEAIRKREAELAAELEAKAVAAAKEAAGEDADEEVEDEVTAEAETATVEAQATEEVKSEPTEENSNTEEDKKAE